MARGSAGDDLARRVADEPPSHEPPDVYLYSPMRPVPTVGGQVILPGGNAAGPRDQQAVEGRDDVLVYSTAGAGAAS